MTRRYERDRLAAKAEWGGNGAGYLKLIMCQLSGSTLSARCRPAGR
jgi:hypothetical protein